MTWPFPEKIRPLIRSVIFFTERGESSEQIEQRLTAPPHRHPAADVALAMPEARRALLFAEELRIAPSDMPASEVWQLFAENIWYEAYGRTPTEAERTWWLTRPGNMLGLKAKITIEGVDNYQITPTVNVPWDATLEQIRESLRSWYLTGQGSPAPPGSAAATVQEGARVNVEIVGGALVPRIDPTLTLHRGA